MVATIERLDGYITPSQASARLGVAEATLRQWASRGRMPTLVTPHGRLYRESEIEQIARQRAEKRETPC